MPVAYLPIEEIEKMVGSRYALTVLAGKRARDLRDGAPQLVNSDESNPILVALQEIYEGKVIPKNLDLSAGIELREAIAQAKAAREAKAEAAEISAAAYATATASATAAAILPPIEEVFAIPIPAELLSILEPVPEPYLAPDAIAIDLEIDDEDLVDPEEFAALDGHIDPMPGVDATEE
jgi:DNA-directed RNA polymerase omega subunit